MNKEQVIRAWNEADELREDFAMSDEEITRVIPDLRERVKRICELLENEFSTEEYHKVFPINTFSEVGL